ncbi:MAG: DUF4230 domain-containing protein [Anaerolineaceae bacterium]|nr:DUF4230 domain-containing protein [Anaerolineaceae bacterium]
MTEKKSNLGKIFFFIAFLVVIILAAGWMMLQSVTNSIDNTISKAVSPLNQANDAISTQVAEILHPTPTIIPDPITIIHEVRALARLETIQYSVEKVITSEVNQGLFQSLFGDKILFVAHGVVIAGIDLNQLNPDNMKMVNGVLTIELPEAEIFITSLDNQKSYVYDRDTGLFNKGYVELETAARQAAEQEIYNAAIEDGILDQANQNAEVFMSGFFDSLGFEDVVFIRTEK